MAKPLSERVAEWLLGRPNGATSPELQLEFGISHKRVLNLRDYYRDTERYTSHWSGLPFRQGHRTPVEARLYITAIAPRKPASVRKHFYATPLPGHTGEPVVFMGVYALRENLYNTASVNRALNRPTTHAEYVWSSKPVAGYKYRPIYSKEHHHD